MDRAENNGSGDSEVTGTLVKRRVGSSIGKPRNALAQKPICVECGGEASYRAKRCIKCREAFKADAQSRKKEYDRERQKKMYSSEPPPKKGDAFNGSDLLHMPVEKTLKALEAILSGKAVFAP
jgi:ribosomal protein L40E